ncbi:uncharacterized protein [Malus domestica]|uniref:uncharacterized protein isoform X2 n=1 Tax=Malus domestica TaxID=3750 RepID=UPI0039757904
METRHSRNGWKKYGTSLYISSQQDAIEVCSIEMDHEVLASKVQAGNCYEITNFRINRRKGEYIVVPNDSQTVFTHKTVFKRITNEFPRILHHRFFLQDYNMLYPRLDRVDILTGSVILYSTGHYRNKLIQISVFEFSIFSQNIALLFKRSK